MRAWLVAAVMACTSGAAFAAPPPARQPKVKSAPAASSAAPQLSPADQKRLHAIQQYQHDLVNVVALRADPDYLLGAAILARPFQGQTPGLDFAALADRAATGAKAGEAAHWAQLADCKDAAACPNATALTYLQQHAAGNAAVWVMTLDAAVLHHDAKAAKVALDKAAAAQVYDDYYGKALAGIALATGVLPPLPDTTDGAHGGQPNHPDGVRVLVAVNASEGYPRPDLDPVVQACAKDAVAKDAHTRETCLKLAHTLQWGSSPVARAVGLHIQGELASGDGAADAQSARNLAWQVQQYSALLQQALVTPTLSSQWLAGARNGGTELSLILATLRASHVPTEAPSSAPSSAPATGP